MNTPFIWSLIPICFGIISFLLQRWKRSVVVAGTILVFILTLGAWIIPIGEIVSVGPWSFSLGDRFTIAGLQFVLGNAERSLLIILYASTGFIFGGASSARTDSRFVPLGLIVVAVLIAALSVEPIFYGVIIFQMEMLLCGLILAPPGSPVSKGVLRFLVFQNIGLAFILLAGWILPDSNAIVDDLPSVIRANAVLGIGFMFLFAIFPLYTWVIMIAEDTHPYTAVFVFSMIFGAYTLYFLSYVENYLWLFEFSDYFEVIRIIGVLMVGTGGVLAAFQRHLGRILGYAIVIEVGHALLSIGVRNGDLYYAMLVPRIISLAVWGLGLSVLDSHTIDLRFRSVQGMARIFPVASGALLVAHFSIAGVPLLAGFPLNSALWEQLMSFSSSLAVWSFIGSVGLIAGGLRSFAVLVMGPEELPWHAGEDFFQQVFLFIGMLCILLFGIFPHWAYPLLVNLAGSYRFLNP